MTSVPTSHQMCADKPHQTLLSPVVSALFQELGSRAAELAGAFVVNEVTPSKTKTTNPSTNEEKGPERA